MGIKSEPFCGVVLSGDDIGKFQTQVKKYRPNKAALATVARGTKLASQFQRKGYVVVKATPKRTVAAKVG